jgi:hypothetical protein
VIITLTAAEIRLSIFLAKARYQAARVAGVTDAKRGDQSSEETDLTGIGAEMAFCRAFNVYPDLTIGGAMRGSHDAIWAGRTVDVKGSTLGHARLLAVPWKTKTPSDIYALMTGDFPTYTFRGMATATELLDASRLTDLGHGPVYAMPQSELALP